jgi:hypothetical protein
MQKNNCLSQKGGRPRSDGELFYVIKSPVSFLAGGDRRAGARAVRLDRRGDRNSRNELLIFVPLSEGDRPAGLGVVP